jgi:hypothetical protein
MIYQERIILYMLLESCHYSLALNLLTKVLEFEQFTVKKMLIVKFC